MPRPLPAQHPGDRARIDPRLARHFPLARLGRDLPHRLDEPFPAHRPALLRHPSSSSVVAVLQSTIPQYVQFVNYFVRTGPVALDFLPQVSDKMQYSLYNDTRCDCEDEEAPIAPKVGAVIRSLREQRGLNQAELARLADIQRSRLNRIENLNRDRVDADVLARIARALDVTTDEIYIQAGILRVPNVEAALRRKRMDRIFQQLSPARQEEIIALAIALGSMPVPLIRPSDVLEKGDQIENATEQDDE